MRKRFLIFLVTCALALSLIAFIPKVNASGTIDEATLTSETSYDLTSNYFVQSDGVSHISSPLIESFTDLGYIKAGENDELVLYLLKKSLNIAVLVKDTGYIFYTDNRYNQFDLEAYLTTGSLAAISSTLVKNGTYTTSLVSNAVPTLTYVVNSSGFTCEFVYDKIGISYALKVSLDGKKLLVNVPKDSIKEEGYTDIKTTLKKDDQGNLVKDDQGNFIIVTTKTNYHYALTSLTFFPYFGSTYQVDSNNWMSGYTFIPDGSGALIRYQNQKTYQTAYRKRVYGDDGGIDNVTSSRDWIKAESTITLPIYGVVHGVNQNAFLCVIREGDANAELDSNPYGYNNQMLETTYYKFYYRSTYSIDMTTGSGSIATINSELYSGNILYSYDFLDGSRANYSGMASYYKTNYLTLTDSVDEEKNVSLNLKVLAQDYKKGLFGKNYIEMTNYEEMLEMVKELENAGISGFNINYIGCFKGGFYSLSSKPSVSLNLGSKRKFMALTSYLSSKGYSLDAYLDPTTVYQSGVKGTVKKLNLSTYAVGTDSSYIKEAYKVGYTNFSKSVTNYDNVYASYEMKGVTLLRIGERLTSYRYKNVNYYREDNKLTVISELNNLKNSGYEVGLNTPNSYTYSYLSKYYAASVQTSLYTYITDSIPFISLLLSGSIEIYSEDTNYVDDYLKNALRLIEYGIYPSFVVTKEESSKLRYTNFEGFYCSEYDRWKGVILAYYNLVSAALKEVRGEAMVAHQYLADGVVMVTYSNGKAILINYSVNPYQYGTVTVPVKGYKVVNL